MTFINCTNKGLSEEIQRLCRGLNVKICFKSHNTLRELGVVYEIPCQDCEKVYIGETGRSLQKRMTEHKAAVRRG